MSAQIERADCLIVGGGPAGLMAAVYLGRYRRRVLVVDDGDSRAAKIPKSHNYPGFRGISGRDLLQRLRVQANEYGALLRSGRVTSLREIDGSFTAIGANIEVQARSVLLATGLIDKCPKIVGAGPDGLPDLRWLRSH